MKRNIAQEFRNHLEKNNVKKGNFILHCISKMRGRWWCIFTEYMTLYSCIYIFGSWNLNGVRLFTVDAMAKSKYEYVRDYEQDLMIARNNFIILRIDGRRFHQWVTY